MAKRLKVLLTGSNGYLGKYLINQFKNTTFEINKFTRNDINKLLEQYRNDKKDFNLSTNHKFDVIIHAAALPFDECKKDPFKAKIINTLLTEILSEYCIANNCFFIFFSSVQVYGEILDGIYSEDSDLSPVSQYSITKANAEKDLLIKISKGLMRGSILRIGNIIGLPQTNFCKGWDLFSNNIIKNAVFDKKIIIKNNPNIRRNFLPADLLKQLIIKILEDYRHNNRIPKLINVTCGFSKTLFEYSLLVAKSYYEIFDEKIRITYEKKLIQNIPYSIIQNDVLKKYLNSERELNLNDEINEIINFLKNKNI